MARRSRSTWTSTSMTLTLRTKKQWPSELACSDRIGWGHPSREALAAFVAERDFSA
jgi:hypothetical protein